MSSDAQEEPQKLQGIDYATEPLELLAVESSTALITAPSAQSTAVATISGDHLTLWGTARPPPPLDPFVYNAEAERREFCRSLIPDVELTAIDEEIKRSGFMPIDQVRELIRVNMSKENMDTRGETYALDAETMIVIDARTNYKIFIAGDNVYTREELYTHFPFHDLKSDPENVFVQQEIGVFPPRKHAMNADDFEYVARDLGDETIEFVMIEDMVGRAARKNYQAKRAPAKVVKTKIFLGKDKWDDFQMIHRLAKGVVNISGGKQMSPLFAMLAAPQRPMLMDEATMIAQQKRMEEQVRQREEEARIREEAAKLREEENRRVEQRIQADLKRIEKMLSEVGRANVGRTGATRPHKPAAATPAATPCPPMTAREDNVAADEMDDAGLRETLQEIETRGPPPSSSGGDEPAAASDDSVPL
jgi:hypothetical protein